MDSLVLYTIALLLLIHWALSVRRRKEIAFLLVFLAASAALALYQGVDILLLLLGVLSTTAATKAVSRQSGPMNGNEITAVTAKYAAVPARLFFRL